MGMMGHMDGGRRLLERETSKPQSVGKTLATFGRYFGKHWVGVAAAFVLILVATATQIISPILTGQAVNCYLVPNLTPGACTYAQISVSTTIAERIAGIGQISLIMIGIFLVGAVASGLAFYAVRWAGAHAMQRIRGDLFQHLNNLSVGYYAEHEAGDLMSRITNDSDTIDQMFSFALLNVVTGALSVVSIAIAMLVMNVPYGLLSLVIVPFMVVTTVYFSTMARRAFRKTRQQMGNVNADLQESISGVREVQAFNREDESILKFRETNAANRDANIRAASFTSALSPVLEALGYIALAIVVVVGGLSLLRNEPLFGTAVISLGTIVVFVQFVQRFNQPIQQIATLWTNVQSAIAGGERIFGLLETPPDIVDKPDAIDMPQIQGHVVFDRVRAHYQTGQPVLKGLSFEAQPGQTVAIVGPTGAGKTTIINLVPRFYDAADGSVKIDGIDVRDVKAATLRSQIGIVLQDTFLFSDTVLNNIRYGKLDATDEEVIAAAKLVEADGFIERLPQGYQTILGERGSGLSQGQRQMIAIARAALMSPRILILDEATSSVDTRTERLIQKAFEKMLKGRTSFVIAHRLSTIRNADQVLMVQDGEIVERGTHNELLELQGAYYDLYMSQYRREEEPEQPSGGLRLSPAPAPSGD